MADLTKIDVLNSEPIGGVMLADLLGKDFSKATGIEEDFHTHQLKIMSHYVADYVDGFNSARDSDQEGEEKIEERKRKKAFNMMKAMVNADVFHHKGFNLNFEQVVNSVDDIINDKKEELKKTEADIPVKDEDLVKVAATGQVYQGTQEQYEHLIQMRGPEFFEGKVVEDMTIEQDGQLMDKDAIARAESIKAQIEEAQQIKADIDKLVEEGKASPDEVKAYLDTLDPALKDQILEAHIESEHELPTDVADYDESQPDETLNVTEAKAPAPPATAVTLKPDTLTP